MVDFDVQRFTRRCAITDREFQTGETVYSVLVEKDGQVTRLDYSQEAWQGAPDDVIAQWKYQSPSSGANKTQWAPHEVMLDYFEKLEHDPSKQDVRFVLALLMIRRRIVRLERTETDDIGRQQMILFCPHNEKEYIATDVTPSGPRVEEIQQELAQLLFSDGE